MWRDIIRTTGMPGNQFQKKWSCMIGAHKAIDYISQLQSNQIELLIRNVYQIYVQMSLNCVQYIQINPSFSSEF